MLEGLSNIDINSFINKLIDVFFEILKIPIKFWINLPWYVRGTIYLLILLFAIFMAFVTIRYRKAYKLRY